MGCPQEEEGAPVVEVGDEPAMGEEAGEAMAVLHARQRAMVHVVAPLEDRETFMTTAYMYKPP